MPSYPSHLLATVALKYLGPLPPSPEYTTSFVLKPASPTGPYNGSSIDGTNRISLVFYWAQGMTAGYADGIFRVGIYFTPGTWETQPVSQNPYLRYESHNVDVGPVNRYATTLVITA